MKLLCYVSIALFCATILYAGVTVVQGIFNVIIGIAFVFIEPELGIVQFGYGVAQLIINAGFIILPCIIVIVYVLIPYITKTTRPKFKLPFRRK